MKLILSCEHLKNIISDFIFIFGSMLLFYACHDQAFETAKLKIKENPRYYFELEATLKENKELIQLALNQDIEIYPSLDEAFKNDPAFAQMALKQKGQWLAMLDPSIQDHTELVISAVKQDGRALAFASPRLKNDRNTVLNAIAEDGRAIEFASVALQSNEEALALARKSLLRDIDKYDLGLNDIPSFLQNDLYIFNKTKKITIRQIQEEILSYEDIPKSFKEDLDVFHALVANDGMLLRYAAPSLKNSKNLVLTALEQNLNALKYVTSPQLLFDQDILMKAIKLNIEFFEKAPIELKKNKDIILEAVKKDYRVFKKIPDHLKENQEIALELVKQCGVCLEWLSNSLKNNQRIVLEAIRNHNIEDDKPHPFQFASYDLTKNEAFLLKAAKYLGFVPSAFKDDESFVLEALKYQSISAKREPHGYILSDASDRLKDNRDLVWKALEFNYDVLCYASDRLKNDKALVNRALDFNSNAFHCASKKLQNDYELAFKAVSLDRVGGYFKEYNYAFERFSESWRNNRTLAMKAISCHSCSGQSFSAVSSRLKNDKEFILYALKNASYYNGVGALITDYIPHNLQNDKELILEAIRHNVKHQYTDHSYPFSLDHISEALKNDLDFWKEAVKIDSRIINEIAPDLNQLSDFVLELFKVNPNILRDSSDNPAIINLKKQYAFMSTAILYNMNAIEYADKHLQANTGLLKLLDDKELALNQIKRGHQIIHVLSDRLKNDKEIALLSMAQSHLNYEYISDNLKDNHDILSALHEQILKELYDFKEWQNFYHKKNIKTTNFELFEGNTEILSSLLTKDKALIIAAVKIDARFLDSHDGFFRKYKKNKDILAILDDQKIMEAQVKRNGNHLEYASQRLRDNERLVKLAISQDQTALKFASERLLQKFKK